MFSGSQASKLSELLRECSVLDLAIHHRVRFKREENSARRPALRFTPRVFHIPTIAELAAFTNAFIKRRTNSPKVARDLSGEIVPSGYVVECALRNGITASISICRCFQEGRDECLGWEQFMIEREIYKKICI